MLSKHFIFVTIAVMLLCTSNLYSQIKKITSPAAKTETVTTKKTTDKETKYTRWSMRAGGNLSVIYLARNVKEKNNEPGYCGGFIYEINNFVRVSGLYTRFRPINIEPTWLNVRANTYEVNFEILARFPNQKTLLYPFAGFSYNTFSGFFTGQLDFLNLKEYYPINSTIKNQWLGFNLGTGLEHNFGIIGVFIDYRMRVGRQENSINIMDVCYTGGLKIRFPYGKLAKSIPAKTGRRFRWF